MMKKVSVFLKKIFVLIMTVTVAASCGAPAVPADDAKAEPWERSAATHRSNLKNSIEHIKKLDKSVYTAESVSALKTALTEASKICKNKNLGAKEYWSARNALEYARAGLVYSETGDDGPYKQPFRELSAEEVIAEMGAGINLGNTLDGHSSMMPAETAWQPVRVTKELIKSMHDGGYNTIRIPVTWGKKIVYDEKSGNYYIDEAWLDRVQEIVDYAYSQGMYVIINIHHDGVNWNSGWFNVGSNDIDAVMDKYADVWKIIAERFKDYDEHLIFESMNEITSAQTDGKMWEGGAFEYDTDIIRNFNQLFVNTVRSTGSNNTKRWLAAKGHFAFTGRVEMPADPANDGVSHLMYSAHIYNSVTARYKGIKELADNYADLGCPLILGEWTTYIGYDSDTETGYNDIQKAFQSEMVYKYAKVNNICAIAWDIGVFRKGLKIEQGNAAYWSRADEMPGFQSQLRGVMRGAYLPLTEENKNGDLSDVYEQYGLDPKRGVDQNPKTVSETRITEISCENGVNIMSGESIIITPRVSPANTNDVLVWTTDNDNVVTVSNGRLAAKAPGTAIVTVYALNTIDFGYYGNYNDDPYKNAVKKEISVTVSPRTDFSSQITGTDSLSLEVGRSGVLDLAANSGAVMYFSSDDEKTITVSPAGRVFAKSVGTANITAVSGDGAKKVIPVTVTKTGENTDNSAKYSEIGIFVLYNDTAHGYYENETGDTVKISKAGTYTLAYDIAKHQSEAAAGAGIDTINTLTAIYLKDIEAHNGAVPQSAIKSCKIKWDRITVNGEEMSITAKDAFDPINSSGVFDSGKPVNGWEGNDISGVEISDHTVFFTAVKNPTKIEITFTVSDIVFNE